jgi:PAS domain-containing protein
VIANDRIRWMHADGNCTLDQAGRPMRAIGSLVDITDQKELEARRISLAPH